jgi:hypothetical protein
MFPVRYEMDLYILFGRVKILTFVYYFVSATCFDPKDHRQAVFI